MSIAFFASARHIHQPLPHAGMPCHHCQAYTPHQGLRTYVSVALCLVPLFAWTKSVNYRCGQCGTVAAAKPALNAPAIPAMRRFGFVVPMLALVGAIGFAITDNHLKRVAHRQEMHARQEAHDQAKLAVAAWDEAEARCKHAVDAAVADYPNSRVKELRDRQPEAPSALVGAPFVKRSNDRAPESRYVGDSPCSARISDELRTFARAVPHGEDHDAEGALEDARELFAKAKTLEPPKVVVVADYRYYRSSGGAIGVVAWISVPDGKLVAVEREAAKVSYAQYSSTLRRRLGRAADAWSKTARSGS
jgi:hypothetical protein